MNSHLKGVQENVKIFRASLKLIQKLNHKVTEENFSETVKTNELQFKQLK